MPLPTNGSVFGGCLALVSLDPVDETDYKLNMRSRKYVWIYLPRELLTSKVYRFS